MHNPHNKTYLFVHVIWSVKNRALLFTKPAQTELFKMMLQNAKEKNNPIIVLNSVEDHVHCLLQLHPTQSVSGIVPQLKGSAAFGINQSKLMDVDFKWQDGYAAYSVSKSVCCKKAHQVH